MDNFKWNTEMVKELCTSFMPKEFEQSILKKIDSYKEGKTIYWKEKEYEILTMINCKLGVHDYNWECQLSKETEKCKIHSVKRLNDSSVWVIGEKVTRYYGGGFLNGFIKSFSKEGVATCTNMIPEGNDWDCIINDLIHLEKPKVEYKQPILTTEDGVKIYDRNKCYRVDQNWFIYQGNDYAYIPTPDTNKYFSTDQAAKDYVVENKPCLSYSNVAYWLNLPYPSSMIIDDKFKRLKEFVKTKLNG